jgi:hypothetical protein
VNDLDTLIRTALESDDPDLLVAAHKLSTSPYYCFQPRPDNPEQLDQQTTFVEDQFAGIACVLGGNRSGKTRASAFKVAKFIRDTPPPDRTTRFWVICQTQEMSSGICWAQHLEEFLPEAVVTGWYSEKKGYPSSVTFGHPNGNRWMVEFKSYDMGRQALQAAAIAGFWADEQIEYNLLTEILARCSNYRFPGSKIYSLTPLKPDYELEKIYAEQERHPGWRFYRLNTLLNSTIDASFLDHELDELRDTRTIGAFASYSGSIYRNFGSRHVVEPPEIPKGWRHVAGLDFGWDHPTVMICAAVDLAGRYWVYDEYVQSKNSVEEHVETIKSLWQGGPDHGDIWADAAAAQDRHEFSIRGLPTRSAHKDVIAGIARVQEMLRPAADGKPKLLISKKCENLIREMRTYQWHPTIPNRVLKKDDDCVDALRYLIFSDGNQYKPIGNLKVQQNRYFAHSNRP